jgi:hypothetical protein
MILQHLCSALCAEVYFDQLNNWLFIDWVGELSLATVQHTCLGIAHCFLAHYSPRVLTSNAQVTSVSPEATQWLASDFLPTLSLTGIEQMAWVVPSPLRARNQVLDTVNLFPHIAISLFYDVEAAVAWLQQTAPRPSASGTPNLLQGRHFSDEQKLQRIVASFSQQLATQPVPTCLAG